MSFGLGELKEDQLSKSYFYNRMVQNYENVPADHEVSEFIPLITNDLFPIELTDKRDYLSGVQFAGKIILDTPVFRWEGVATFFRKREAMWDDIGRIDREHISMWFAEYSINEASDEVFGADVLDGIYSKLRYCPIQNVVHSQKMKIYVSDIVYLLTFSPTPDWEGL